MKNFIQLHVTLHNAPYTLGFTLISRAFGYSLFITFLILSVFLLFSIHL